jgi:glycosyltransferase involved in cell wall biosynthesis
LTATAFLRDQIREAGKRYAVSVVANTRDPDFLRPYGITSEVIPIGIERKIKPLVDLGALWRLWRLFRRRGFGLVHSVSPKAGLLAMLAALLAGVPVRVHTFTGQVWATRKGIARLILRRLDWLLGILTTRPLVDSSSQRDFLVLEKVLPMGKARVLAHGSISGVDTQRFQPNKKARAEIRGRYNIDPKDIVFLCVGRLNTDKGILDLAHAFAGLADEYRGIHLMLVGPDEEDVADTVRKICVSCVERLHLVGQTDRPEEYMAAADVFCLPSYREGFGSVIIEAAAAGVPAIGSRIYGITDAVEEGRTGFLHEPRDVQGIAELMQRYLQDPSLRQRMGEAARHRARKLYAQEEVTDALMAFYAEALADA